MKKGIDVSTWQGDIDFKKVKAAGYDFVIIRAGYGKLSTQKDNKFEQNYKNAKAAGLNVGAYWYSYADSADEATKEAQACLQAIAGKQFEYPVFFDMEEAKQMKSREFCDSLINAFCSKMEKSGYFVGLYSNLSTLNTYVSEAVRKRYAIWLAQWASKPTYNGAYGIWQKSDKGSVPGIKGNVDLDESYIDYPRIIKAKGLNGFKLISTDPAPETETKTKTLEIILGGKTIFKGEV